MHVDAHEPVDNFVLTYLKGEDIAEDQHLAAITKKIDTEDGLEAIHYLPQEQSSEISGYALKTFYRSKFSEGLESYNEKRNLTMIGYELLSENIGSETLEGDTLVEEKGLEGAFETLERGHPASTGNSSTDMSDSEKARKITKHRY
jgi:hypothetical protein